MLSLKKLRNFGNFLDKSINYAIEGIDYELGKINTLIGGIFNVPGFSINSALRLQLNAELKIILDNLETYINQFAYVTDKLILRSETAARELIIQTYNSLSDLRNQIENIVDKLIKLASSFTPEAIRKNLIDPILDKLNNLQNNFFINVERLLDKIDEIFTGTIEDVRNDIKSLLDPILLFPNPFDECRQKLNLGNKLGTSLTAIEIYRFRECQVLKGLNENTTIARLTDSYGGLQLNAWKIACVSRGAPDLKKKLIQDWIKYGQLIDLWSQFPMAMTPLEAAQETVRRLEEARLEFLAKSAQIDSINAAVQKAQQTADTAYSIASVAQTAANAAQATSDDAITRADRVAERTKFIRHDGVETFIDSPLHVDSTFNVLIFQSDGNLVIYKKEDGTLKGIWHTKTYPPGLHGT
ncbi:alanine-zipper protein [Floridanema aerugineum]|uniref:Alanine-zipper protein n=1 Tax=Floridaenema aerugineum BLCC-F46 TaxID=3153654 RepID=A0ABV4XF95_9CYAN